MLQSLKSVSYRVPDLERAKQWYRALLGCDPAFDSPMAVIFTVGDSALTLLPIEGSSAASDRRPVAYWGVEDIDATYRRLLDSGATSESDVFRSVLSTRVARVVDPFGNILGLMSKPAAASAGALESQPSDSAMGVAFSRALSALDTREEIKGPDYIAALFLTPDFKRPLMDPNAREYVARKSPGSYHFFIARTAHLDALVRQALEEDIPQIVNLGAGYDTRACRFRDLIRDTRIFELDLGPTQQRKRRLLEEAKVSLPPQLAFVTINFARDSLEDVLGRAGFKSGRRTLYIWEGVTYYLQAQQVDQTLAFIRSHSAPGSRVSFDYLVDAPDMSSRYGVEAALTSMRTMYPAEPVQFAIPEGSIHAFLAERGFSLVEHLTPEEMEHRYLTLRDGSTAGKVLACFCLAQASVAG